MRIRSRTGRRPILAAGNSNGDIPSAEQALEQAAKAGWTVASIKNDWTRVF